MRNELTLIEQWIRPGSTVLDLGCGDGTMLAHLMSTRRVLGYGLEINQDQIAECLRKNVNVIEQDLDKGLVNFGTGSVDVVLMTQALQTVTYPEKVLDHMLRVGKECIVTFPNFGHWKNRAQVLFRGRMPVSRSMPYSWYDTPNIHLCTFKDFEALCRQKSIHIIDRAVVDVGYDHGVAMRMMPNLLGETAIYRMTRRS